MTGRPVILQVTPEWTTKVQMLSLPKDAVLLGVVKQWASTLPSLIYRMPRSNKTPPERMVERPIVFVATGKSWPDPPEGYGPWVYVESFVHARSYESVGAAKFYHLLRAGARL